MDLVKCKMSFESTNKKGEKVTIPYTLYALRLENGTYVRVDSHKIVNNEGVVVRNNAMALNSLATLVNYEDIKDNLI